VIIGSLKLAFQMSTRIPYCHTQMLKLLRNCVLVAAPSICFLKISQTIQPESEEGSSGLSTIVMLKTFILSNIVPNICQRLPDLAALVLGKALLWLIYLPYNATPNNLVPQEFANRIQIEVDEIVLHGTNNSVLIDANYNPICCVPVIVAGDQSSLCLYRC
jgi:hypothetical protein